MNFLLDENYPKKDFESFYDHYVATYGAEAQKKAIEKNQRSYSYVIQAKEMLKEGFDQFIHQHLEESVDDFLVNKSKEYSNRYDGFLMYLQEYKSNFIDAITEWKIKSIYYERYVLYLKSQDKNEFGLEFKDVDDQLDRIFR